MQSPEALSLYFEFLFLAAQSLTFQLKFFCTCNIKGNFPQSSPQYNS